MIEIDLNDFSRRLLDESKLGVVVTDLGGRIQCVSEPFLKMCGYTERELIGKTPQTFKSGQTPTSVYRSLWETIRKGETWSGAILNKRKDGTLFLDRETIIGGITLNGRQSAHVAVHRAADIELDLRLKLSRTESALGKSIDEIDNAKSAINTLVTLTTVQVERTSMALVAALEARDPNTIGHSRRTSLLMDLIGTELGLFESYSRESIHIGAILHDFGKIGIPDSIMLKEGRLTDAEFDVMRTHPAIGFDILSLALKDEVPLRIVRHHHERLDGSGYPDGLNGSQLPDYVKIFSVCDCFDAMTSKRCYRPAIAPDAALSMLTDDALSGLLDMSAVRALRRLWANGVLMDVIGLQIAA